MLRRYVHAINFVPIGAVVELTYSVPVLLKRAGILAGTLRGTSIWAI